MRKIRLCYRKIIGIDSVKAWDRAVFNDTHMEFYMQAQRLDLDGKYETFKELEDHVSGATHLHYLTGTAAVGYVRQLDGIVPDVVNAHGKLCVPFSDFKFEIIQSHITNKAMHKIAILFYSDYMMWIDSVGDQLVVSYGDQLERLNNQTEAEVDVIPMVPYLSISHIIMQ